MGYHRSFLFAAPLLLAQPAHAQQAEEAAPVFTLPPSSTPQPANPRQQGPELDVFRAPATTTATTTVPPPVVTPTVTPTPAPVQPAPQAPAQRVSPAPMRRATPTPTAPRPATDEETTTARIENAPTANPAPQPQPAPTPAAAAPEEAPLSPAPTGTTPWPWIIGGGVALLALAAALLLRRRSKPVPDEAEANIAPVDPIPVATPPNPTPAPTPEPAPVAVTPDAPDRPWLDMALGLTQARYSLMGMTVGYTLLLHNRGDIPAQDVLVRGVIGNAGAQQQALLQSFFTQQSGLPLHAAVSIMPGETRRLTGELRLMPDQIVPVTMGQRSLLIPLAAFDASYRWGPEADDPQAEPLGNGRTARAFILGQEQEPPAERLAPFRLDQGPRQYRRAAARAAGELVPS